jgi:hypothetical protein
MWHVQIGKHLLRCNHLLLKYRQVFFECHILRATLDSLESSERGSEHEALSSPHVGLQVRQSRGHLGRAARL